MIKTRRAMVVLRVLLVVCGSGFASEANAQPDTPIVGPMVGHVTDTEATLWAYGGPGVDFDVLIWPEGDLFSAQLLPMTADRTRYDSATLTISGLNPSPTYRYHVAR